MAERASILDAQESGAAPIAGADRPLIGLLAAGLLLNAAIFAYVTVVGFVKQPFSDMFHFLEDLFDWQRGGGLLTYFWRLHNGQRLVWMRVLTLLDVRAFHGTGVVFPLVASLALVWAAALAAYVLRRSLPSRAVAACAGLLSGMFVFDAVNATDTTQPINAGYAVTFALAVAAIVLFESPGWRFRRRAGLAPILAFPAAVGAMLGSAAGLALWPVLALSALRDRRRGLLLVVTAMAVVLFGLFWHDARVSAGPHAPTYSGFHPLKMAQYFLLYCGMPWSQARLPMFIRLAPGAGGALLGLWLALRGPHLAGPAGRVERIGLDLILFGLVTAVMAAAGRVDENAELVVPFRYTVFLSAYQCGFVFVIAARLASRWPAARRPASAVMAVATVGLIVFQLLAAGMVLRTSAIIRANIAAFNAGQRTPDMTRSIHYDLNFAAHVTSEYRRQGLYR
jgi:hypothetical protein